MQPQDNIDNHEIDDKEDQPAQEAERNAAPQPFAFLQPFGEEAIGMCDAEGKCS